LRDPGLEEKIMNHHTAPFDRDAVLLAIKGIVQDALHLQTAPAELADDTRLDTLGLDSLNIVDILLGMERAFDVAFDEADLDFSILESVSTLADFVLAARSA
jgi:acyl carrier protein